jgi:hypothetical protein
LYYNCNLFILQCQIVLFSATPSPALAINNRISEIERKLNTLLDGYINQIIDEEEYKHKKSTLLNEKLELKEKLKNLDGKGKVWLELARTFVSSADQASYIATEGTLDEKRVFLKKIGSNFRLSGAKLLFSYRLPYSFLVEKPPKIKWGEMYRAIRDYFKGSPLK